MLKVGLEEYGDGRKDVDNRPPKKASWWKAPTNPWLAVGGEWWGELCEIVEWRVPGRRVQSQKLCILIFDCKDGKSDQEGGHFEKKEEKEGFCASTWSHWQEEIDEKIKNSEGVHRIK